MTAVSLSVDSLGVSTAVFKEEGPNFVSRAQGAPNFDFGRVMCGFSYDIGFLFCPKSQVLAVYVTIKMKVCFVAIPLWLTKATLCLHFLKNQAQLRHFWAVSGLPLASGIHTTCAGTAPHPLVPSGAPWLCHTRSPG